LTIEQFVYTAYDLNKAKKEMIFSLQIPTTVIHNPAVLTIFKESY